MTRFDQLNNAIATLRSYADADDQMTTDPMAIAAVLHALSVQNEGRAYVGLLGADHVNSHLGGHPVHDFVNHLHANASESAKPHIEAIRGAAVNHFNTLKDHATRFHAAASEHLSRVHEHVTQHLGPTLQQHFGEAHSAIAGHLSTLHAHAQTHFNSEHLQKHLTSLHQTIHQHPAMREFYHQRRMKRSQQATARVRQKYSGATTVNSEGERVSKSGNTYR